MPLDDERRISTEAGMAFVENDLKGVSADDGTFWLRYRWVGGETPGRIRLPQPAEELPIEKALEYLLKHHNRARHCPNPDCPAPYFLAARQSRRYCSEICAQSGERETKRRWWAEHGPAWRKKRKPAASKSRRGKRDKTAEQSKGLKLKVTRSRKKGK